METFKIEIDTPVGAQQFEVADYLHHEDDKCKFEVFQNDVFVAGFEPSRNHYLQLCKNPGQLNDSVLHLIADKLESLHLY